MRMSYGVYFKNITKRYFYAFWFADQQFHLNIIWKFKLCIVYLYYL